MKRFLRISLWIVLAIVVLLTATAGIRYAIAMNTVAQFDRAERLRLASIGATDHLTILPLFEKAADAPDLASGHGVAYLVQTDTASILVDVGFNPDNLEPSPLERNMARLGVTPEDLDIIYITHHHPDHTGGVTWWTKGSFSMGNSQVSLAGKRILTPIALTYPDVTTEVAAEPQVLAPGVATLGAIPFVDVFPLSLFRPQMIEQVLAVKVNGVGVVLISGCGHPGVARMVRTAEEVLGEPVAGVVGGLHYGDGVTPAVEADIALLSTRDMEIVALSPHDTGPAGLATFANAFRSVYRTIAVGKQISIGEAIAAQ